MVDTISISLNWEVQFGTNSAQGNDQQMQRNSIVGGAGERCAHLLSLAQALCTDQSPIAVVSGQALLLVSGTAGLLAVQRATNLSIQVSAMVTPAVAPVGTVVVGNVSVGVHCAARLVHSGHACCIGC